METAYKYTYTARDKSAYLNALKYKAAYSVHMEH